MRTTLYSRQYPDGKIFDTEPHRPDPLIPSNFKSLGWTEHREELKMTQEQLIDVIVRRELARQPSDRILLEKEVFKKSGQRARATAPESQLIAVLDDK